MVKAIILRGCSGSGKSSFAHKLKEGFEKNGKTVAIVSADDFFMGWSGFVTGADGSTRSHMEYQFDPVKLPEAHQIAFGRYLDALKAKVNIVIADNTFTRLWEVQNYIKAAALAGYPVEVYEFRITTIDELQSCVQRNIHRVPFDVVARMVSSFEPWPGAKSVKIGIPR